MPQLKDNKFAKERIEERQYRLLRMQNNIDTHAAELGVGGQLLAWAQNCNDDFQNKVTNAGVGAGQSKDATILLKREFEKTLDYYQDAKEILTALLRQFKRDDILLDSYGVDKRTPHTYAGIVDVIDDFVETHERLQAAGDPRVVAQAIVDEMISHKSDFVAQKDAASVQRRESEVAYQAMHTAFKDGTARLKLIFKMACMVWGDDSPYLKDLGFVPSTEVWTINTIEAPKDFVYNESDEEFSWNIVEDATNYELQCRATGESGRWTKLFEGEDNHTSVKPAEPGKYDFRVRAIAITRRGKWSEIITL